MQLFVEAILDFMEREDWDEADIFGYSMGGYAALQLALDAQKSAAHRDAGHQIRLDARISGRQNGFSQPGKNEAKVPQFAAALAERHEPADWKMVLRHTAGLLHGLGNGEDCSRKILRKSFARWSFCAENWTTW